MLATRSKDTFVHIRPMRVAHLTEEGHFITSKRSRKAIEIDTDATVDVVFQDNSKFVTMTCNATITDDPRLLEDLWTKAYNVWFPAGKDEYLLKGKTKLNYFPEITLISVFEKVLLL